MRRPEHGVKLLARLKALKAAPTGVLACALSLLDAVLFAKDASTGCRKRALARGLLSKVWVRKDATPEGAYCGFRPVHALHKRLVPA